MEKTLSIKGNNLTLGMIEDLVERAHEVGMTSEAIVRVRTVTTGMPGNDFSEIRLDQDN